MVIYPAPYSDLAATVDFGLARIGDIGETTTRSVLEEFLRPYFLGQPNYLGLLARVPTGLVGGLAGRVVDDQFVAGRREGRIDIVIVHPDHRRGGLGARLIHDFERWAAAQGAESCLMQVPLASPLPQDAVAELGYHPVEVWHRKPLKGDQLWAD